MKRLTSALLTTVFAATTIAPALAGPHEHGGGRPAGPAAAAPAQPRNDNGGSKHAREAVPQQAAPAQRQFVRQERTRPARVERQPQQFIPQERTRPVRVERQPQRFIPQERTRPVRAERQAQQFVPQERIVPRFEQRRVRSENNGVPFAEVVRPKHAKHFVERSQQFVAGRVIRTDNDQVVLENPIGQTFVVRGWHGRHKHWGNRVLTVPVVYRNGVYYAYAEPVVNVVAPSTFTSYIYPVNDIYPASYGYVPAAGYSYTPDSTNYALASTLSSVLSNALGGSHSSSLANSLLTNYLSSYLLNSVAGGAQNYAPVYATNYLTPAGYAAPPLTYTYPMTCVYHDPYDGSSSYDPSCAPATTTTYYTAATPYAPAQVQGVVVGSSGSTLMVLGGNGLKPILVNDAPALQNGFAYAGQPSVGRFVNAYGFYQGDTFVATAIQ